MARKVYIGRCEFGRGVFAGEKIYRGDFVLFIVGKYVSRVENGQLPNAGAYSIQIELEAYVAPVGPMHYLNHSCDPNIGITGELCVVALRDIRRDEEIRFDYSTTMLEDDWTLECHCGTAACRRQVRDFDLLPEALQQHYLELGIVQDFILEAVYGLPPRIVAA